MLIDWFICNGPESAHKSRSYKHVTNSYKSTLKIKDLKTDRLLKWCSSAARLFQGFSTSSAKNTCVKPLGNRLGRSLYAWPLVLWVLSANVKKSLGFISLSPERNLVRQDQVISQTSDFKSFQFWPAGHYITQYDAGCSPGDALWICVGHVLLCEFADVSCVMRPDTKRIQ